MKFKFLFSSVLVCIAVSTPAAFADNQSTAGYSVSVNASDTPPVEGNVTHLNVGGSTPATVSQDFSVSTSTGASEVIGTPFNGSGHAEMDVSAGAGPGLLKVQCTGVTTASDDTAQPMGAIGNVSAGATLTSLTAAFSDSFTMNSAHLAPGATMYIFGSYAITPTSSNNGFHANVDSDSDIEAKYSSINLALYLNFTGDVSSSTPIAKVVEDSNPNDPQIITSAPFDVPSVFECQNGVPFALSSSLTMEGSVESDVGGGVDSGFFDPGTASVFYDANFANTVMWGGISSVTDANNNPITDYSITSDSGFNYQNAAVDNFTLPEPNTLCFVVIAFASAIRLPRKRNFAIA